MPTELIAQEFVGYAYLLIDGPSAEAETAALKTAALLWNSALQWIDGPRRVPGYPEDLSKGLGDGAQSSIVALREGSGVGLHQVVLRRVHDVLVLGVLRSFAEHEPGDWLSASSAWTALIENHHDQLLGSVRILQGRISSDELLSIDHDLQMQVAAAADGPDRLPSWSKAGFVERSAQRGDFAIWSAPGPQDVDTALHRRLVVLAAAPGDAELSAWTWSRGTPEMTPLASYLLHAAILRNLVARRPDPAGLAEELRKTDGALTDLSRHVEAVAKSPAVDPADLRGAAGAVRTRQADDFGLIAALGIRRRLLAAVDVSTANMTAYLDLDHRRGPFAEDAALADWYAAQLRIENASVEERLERGRDITEQADSLLQSALQDRSEQFQLRRERVNLAATGVVGALLMALAAIQAFNYTVPVPGPVQGPVVAFLACFALLSGLLVLRSWRRNGRPLSAAPVITSAALLGAAIGWTVVSIGAELAGRAAPAGESWLGAAVGALIALVSAAIATLERSICERWSAEARREGQ